MIGANVTEVQLWRAPPFYLMIDRQKFSERMTEESQWETLLALLKAGSRGLLGDDLVIHLKSSDTSLSPWAFGNVVTFPPNSYSPSICRTHASLEHSYTRR